MRRGRPNVSTTYCELVPTTSTFWISGLAVRLHPQFHRHAEQVEILVDFANGAETLVVAQPVDRVLVGELGRAGAVDPLREERRQLLLALRLGHLLKIGGAHALVGVLAQRAFQRGQERLVADLPAQHVEDHGALFERHGLELRRKRTQPAGARKRNGVVGQRARGHVLQSGAHGVLAVLLFHVHQLAVAGHAVGDPCVVERLGADFRTPPLVRNGIGQQPDAGLVADARAHHAGQFRTPHRRQRIVGNFHHVQVRRFEAAEVVGKEVELLGRGLRQFVG